jgi:DNA-directed RNA polymerase specialized sigma24 family protein
MKEKTNWRSRLWFPGRDGEMSAVKKELVDAALENSDRLLDYANRQSIDSAQAADMAETLVENLSSKQQELPPSKRIRKPGPYLFTAFVRAVNALRDREKRIKYVAAVAELERLAVVEDWAERLDEAILVHEIVSLMDPDTRRTFWRRLEGYRWQEIARSQSVSGNAAINAYLRGIERVRERIDKGRGRVKP